MVDTFPASEIAFVIVACSLQAANTIDAVSAMLNGSEQVGNIHFAGARHPYDFNIRWIIQSHGTCQVRG